MQRNSLAVGVDLRDLVRLHGDAPAQYLEAYLLVKLAAPTDSDCQQLDDILDLAILTCSCCFFTWGLLVLLARCRG